jgi:hypothetical protein
MRTCRRDTDTDGTHMTYSVVNMRQVADGSIQIRIDFSDGTAFSAFALVGAALVQVGAGGALNPDSALVPDLLRKQAAQYLEAATH